MKTHRNVWRSLPARWSPWLATAAGVGMGVLCLVVVGMCFSSYAERPAAALTWPTGAVAARPGDPEALARRLESARPRGVYLTVDTVANRLQVRRGAEVLREATCSTGTGWVLEDAASGRRWVFETPPGVHVVLAKRRDPVWTRPDWAFIEEGREPPGRWSERLDPDVLGDWALDLGDGYMIHGTLFQRYLGRNVTHGCIRLGDADLAWVAANIPVGATVLVY